MLDPGVVNQYQNATVYTRGGMTLQALRKKIGDAAFFQTLKDYVATFGGGVASTQDFIAIAQRDSGKDLRDFFKRLALHARQAERGVLLLLRRPPRPARSAATCRQRWR